jgi:N-acyl-D-aspartate/D-glutamate deacylase
MLDVLVKGGMVVDGTGRDRFRADVGVKDRRIVSVGTTDETAARTIDAGGLIVAPGFIDVHTHYDAQVFWDPALSPSTLHGVTTVLGGNCGFTIAPMADDHADYLVRMLALVEGMPLDSLRQGVPWGGWRTFGEWLGRLDGNVSANVGFMAGHSTIRRLVMGSDAHNPQPSEAQLQEMERYLREALRDGALGFSTSNGKNHLDGDGNVVPSRCASDEEFLRLASVVAEFPGTSLEYLPSSGAVGDADRMIAMSRGGQRPLNWNVLVVTAARGSAVDDELAVSDRAEAEGARVLALENPAPLVTRQSFYSAFGLNSIPGWEPIVTLPIPDRIKALKDPEVRRRMQEGALHGDKRFAELLDFPGYTIGETFAAQNEGTTGRMVGEIAQERGADPFDTLLDIVVADGLRTTLVLREVGGDDVSRKRRAEAWHDPRVILGASDAGAHLDILALFTYTTDLLGPSARERQFLTVEEGVRLLTEVPARLYGLRHRGRVEVGGYADLVLFDPDTIAPGPIVTRHDLPGGAGRLYADAVGIEHVIVNGTEIVRSGQYTGDRPGQVIRSGVDTDNTSV